MFWPAALAAWIAAETSATSGLIFRVRHRLPEHFVVADRFRLEEIDQHEVVIFHHSSAWPQSARWEQIVKRARPRRATLSS